jgi:hypothetical protein
MISISLLLILVTCTREVLLLYMHSYKGKCMQLSAIPSPSRLLLCVDYFLRFRVYTVGIGPIVSWLCVEVLMLIALTLTLMPYIMVKFR